MKLPKIPVRSAVLAMAPYGAPEEGRARKLRLDFNENMVGCSPAVLRALSRMTAEQIAIYPEYQATTRRLARFFRVRPEEIHLTNGIDDALHLIADAFIEDGDSVLVAEPTFDMFRFFGTHDSFLDSPVFKSPDCAHVFKSSGFGGVASGMLVCETGDSLRDAARLHTVSSEHGCARGRGSFHWRRAISPQLYARSFAKPRVAGGRAHSPWRARLSERGKFRPCGFRSRSASPGVRARAEGNPGA